LLNTRQSRHAETTAERADVDHHVDLCRAVVNGTPGLVVFDIGRRRPEGKTGNRTHTCGAAAQQSRCEGYPVRVDADGRKAVLARLGAELFNLLLRGVGFEQRVIDQRRDAVRHLVAGIQPEP
jgi:hypothetical protein